MLRTNPERMMLASTPPATPWLNTHPYVDTAVRMLVREGSIFIPRFDVEKQNNDLSDEHLAVIRLYDQGLLKPVDVTETHAGWVWKNVDAEAKGVRMLRTRGYGYLPYNLGHHGFTPNTMTGPQLVSMLIWHYRNTDVTRVDISYNPKTQWVTYDTHTLYEEIYTYTVDSCTELPDEVFKTETSHILIHQKNSDNANATNEFSDWVLRNIFTNLSRRVGETIYGKPQVTIDLETYQVRPYQSEPDSFTDALPVSTQDALLTLKAPVFFDKKSFIDWAENNLKFSVMCPIPADLVTHSVNQNRKRPYTIRHTLQLDPYSGHTSTVLTGTKEQQVRLEQTHLISALKYGAENNLKCQMIAKVLAKDGILQDSENVQWGDVKREQIEAIHRVMVTFREIR